MKGFFPNEYPTSYQTIPKMYKRGIPKVMTFSHKNRYTKTLTSFEYIKQI